MNWSEFFEVVTLGSVVGTAIFGVMLGALYGWRAGGGTLELMIVGLGFTVILVAAGVQATDGFSIERAAGRGVLWITLCLLLPVGRRLRLAFEQWRLNRLRRRLRTRPR